MAEIKVLFLLTQLKLRLGKLFNNNSLPNKKSSVLVSKTFIQTSAECITSRYDSVKKGVAKVILSPLI